MTLWAKFKELVDRVAGEDQLARNLREEELRLAAAALLVRASVIDGKIDASERRKLKTLLQERFKLEGEEVRSLLVEAVVREHESVDLYRFTSVVCRELDQDGRKRIVEMLWEVVMPWPRCCRPNGYRARGWAGRSSTSPFISLRRLSYVLLSVGHTSSRFRL
jgi:uncharacterized tellurite resistance protein B-like protein